MKCYECRANEVCPDLDCDNCGKVLLSINNNFVAFITDIQLSMQSYIDDLRAD